MRYLASILFIVTACSSPAPTTQAETSPAETTMAATETTIIETPVTPAVGAEKKTSEKPMSEYKDRVAEIKTTKGTITIRFFPDVAPNHAKNFIDLASQGFYNGTKFHRVIPGFMIQGGDPSTKDSDTARWGTGGSGRNVKAEFNSIPHRRGIVSMARSQSPDSASSQFFIVVADSNFLDNNYTVFGQVTDGMNVADTIVAAPRGAQDRPNDPVMIEKITIRDAKDSEKGSLPN